MNMHFSYNSRSGNIQAGGTNRCIYINNPASGKPFAYYKNRGKTVFLNGEESAELARSLKWFTEHLGCDFGEYASAFMREYGEGGICNA